MRLKLRADPFVKMLHARFHGMLIWTAFIDTLQVKRLTTLMHTFANVFVLNRSFVVGSLMSLYELRFKQRDVLRVIEFHNIGASVDTTRDDVRDDKYVRIPFDHQEWVIYEPNSPVFRKFVLIVTQNLLLPLLVDRRTRLLQGFFDTNCLHTIPITEFPLQVVAIHESIKAWVVWADMIVLKVDFNKRLPIEVVILDNNSIQHVTCEIEFACRAQFCQVGHNITFAVKQ